MTSDHRYPPYGAPEFRGNVSSRPSTDPILIGFGGNVHEASREAVMQLIEKWQTWYPNATEAEAEAALRAMSRGELTRMAMDRHEMDRGQATTSCAVEYDPLPVSRGASDGLPAPGAGPSEDRGWYK